MRLHGLRKKMARLRYLCPPAYMQRATSDETGARARKWWLSKHVDSAEYHKTKVQLQRALFVRTFPLKGPRNHCTHLLMFRQEPGEFSFPRLSPPSVEPIRVRGGCVRACVCGFSAGEGGMSEAAETIKHVPGSKVPKLEIRARKQPVAGL